MHTFEAALVARKLQIGGDQYAINGTLAHAMRWKGNGECIRKKASRAFEPVKESFQRLSEINRGGQGGRLCATLETIVTKIFPLLVPTNPTLQYYIDLWHRDHHLQNQTTNQTDVDQPHVVDSDTTPRDVFISENAIVSSFL